jgi:hypothetical protein
VRVNGRMGGAAAAMALALAAAGAAQANMVLDCQVQASRPDHGLTHWKRRIIVDTPTRTVRILDDFGHGFLQRSEYAFVSIDTRRIMLEQSRGKMSYVDRVSGEYVLRNQPQRFMIRGHCSGAR